MVSNCVLERKMAEPNFLAYPPPDDEVRDALLSEIGKSGDLVALFHDALASLFTQLLTYLKELERDASGEKAVFQVFAEHMHEGGSPHKHSQKHERRKKYEKPIRTGGSVHSRPWNLKKRGTKKTKKGPELRQCLVRDG